jgi:hypothetical protein
LALVEAGVNVQRDVHLACLTADAEYSRRVGRDGRPRVAVRRSGTLIRHDGPEHVFCFAPTRSGKGVGLVVPTLFAWPHSVLVYDIKRSTGRLPSAGAGSFLGCGGLSRRLRTRFGRSAYP